MKPPVQRAQTLQTLVQVMLPGDDDFPSGAAVGVQGKLADRLFDQEGEKTLDEVLDALAGLIDAGQGDPQRAIVASFEASQPQLFALVRSIAYVTYYESPFVQEAIRSLGFAYNPAPLPKGYRVRRFDVAADRPSHGRGHYVPTDQVKRVDLSGLDIQELRHGQ